MTKAKLTDTCLTTWRSLGLTEPNDATLRKRIEDNIQSAVDRVSSHSDRFFFAISETTYTTSAGDTTVKLDGDNNNARAIYSIVDSNIRLYEFDEFEFDALADVTTTLPTTDETLRGWVRRPDIDGFPAVRLSPNPAAGKVLTYRYLRNDVSFDEFPSQFHYVIKDAVLAMLRPDIFGLTSKRSIDEMESHYKPNKQGGQQILPPDHIMRGLARKNVTNNVG